MISPGIAEASLPGVCGTPVLGDLSAEEIGPENHRFSLSRRVEEEHFKGITEVVEPNFGRGQSMKGGKVSGR